VSIYKSKPVCELIVSPHQGDTTTVFFLSGENSTSQDNIPYGLTYYWMLDDSIQIEADSLFNKTTIKIDSIGTHKIELTVKNYWGNSDSQTQEVLIGDYEKDSFFIDPRDGQIYNIVLYGDYWWFSGNLKYGSKLEYWEEPQDNGIVEMYVNDSSIGDNSGYYFWQEAHHYSSHPDSSICPPGWSLPNNESVRYLVNNSMVFEEAARRQLYINGCFARLNFRHEAYYFDMDRQLFKQYTPSFWMANEIITDSNDNPFSDMVYFWGGAPMLVSWNILAITHQGWWPKSQIAVPIRCIKKK